MSEEGGDGLQRHSSVEALGGQGVAQLVRVDAGYACSSGDGYEAETGHHLDVDLWDVLFGARALQWGRAWCPRSPSLAYPSPPSTSPVPPPPSWTRRYADNDESARRIP